MGDGQDRVALVTGASRGIGRAITVELVAQGWHVGALARSAEALESLAAADDAVLPLVADVTDPAAVRAAAQALRQQWHAPDLVVANAGVLQAVGPTWELDGDDWWREIEVNLRGVVNTVAATVQSMIDRGRGRIVLMSSGMGQAPSPWSSAYGASKAAVTHVAGSLARELADSGLSCFAISPGMVATDMTQWPERLMEHRPELRTLPAGSFLPASVAVDLVLALAGGEYDDLSGRFIHARDDRDVLLSQVRAVRP